MCRRLVLREGLFQFGCVFQKNLYMWKRVGPLTKRKNYAICVLMAEARGAKELEDYIFISRWWWCLLLFMYSGDWPI